MFKTIADCEVCSVMWFLNAKNVKPAEIHCQLVDIYGEKIMTDGMVRNEEDNEFLNKIVTGDETWVCHVTPESKQQSIEWRHSWSPTKKKLKQHCQHTKSCALCSGTDRAFCLLSSFPEVKPSMRYDIVKHCKNCIVQFKTKVAEECSVKALYCFMTMHVTFPLVSLETLFNNSVGSSSITRRTAPTRTFRLPLVLELEAGFGGRCLDSDDDAENSV
ncbi:hypothetical protein AVEN_225128-1 [Araneus ventricosus]|uniref:Uncharacterized protein n=1 Tax=Araneus ventricosus TaxID=182803 RepID=A0A4Y2WV90_ARAVE|nr:hypothetical protein AVEN_225128-1 [Araneus ventricosus]